MVCHKDLKTDLDLPQKEHKGMDTKQNNSRGESKRVFCFPSVCYDMIMMRWKLLENISSEPMSLTLCFEEVCCVCVYVCVWSHCELCVSINICFLLSACSSLRLSFVYHGSLKTLEGQFGPPVSLQPLSLWYLHIH